MQVVQRAEAQFAVQERDGLGPHALEMKHVEDGRGKFLEEVLVKPDGAGSAEFDDLRREIFADTRQRAQVGFRELRNGRCRVDHRLGGVPVGADLERILALDFQEVRDLRENACDREIIHAKMLTQNPAISCQPASRSSS